MTAKPQPMAGQSDTSDDLIAELAKLMAQDAQSDKPAEPTRPSSPVRIPGSDTGTTPLPRFDFQASSAPDQSGALDAPEAMAEAAQYNVAPEPVEPFRFDFGLVAPKSIPAPASEQSIPAQVAAPSSPVQMVPDAGFTPADHDTIADLIAAELSNDPEPVMEAPAVPVPAPAPIVAEARPAPPPSSRWSPTAVAANLTAPNTQERIVMRPVNLESAPRPEQDRFKVAPVFGLGSGAAVPSVAPVVSEPVVAAPAPVADAPARTEPSFDWRQPAPEPTPDALDDGIGRDPIDEIESLIGSAMRVELDRANNPAYKSERIVPSPALRSLATPTIPASQAAQSSSSRRPLTGADEAILAAAQATGVKIGWVDTTEQSNPEPVAPRARRAPRALGMTRALAGPLVAVTLLLAAGFGLYWVLGLGREAGPAPLLTADASPSKETPVVDPEAAASQSVVFNEIDGVVPGAEEQLVSRDQADVSEVTQIPPTAEVSEEGLANRKVRTVTVRPDGTIVSGEDSVAGSNILPVARPNVPAVPGAETASEELLASIAAPATATDPAAATPAATPTPAAPAIALVTPGATVPAVDLAGNALAGKTTVVPMTRPAGLEGPGAASFVAPTSPVNAVVNSGSGGGNMLPPPPTNSAFGATAAPAAAATPVAPAQVTTATAQPVEVAPLGNTAPAYAQLASLRTEDEARQAGQNLVTRFGPVFNGANLEVQRVDLGERGIYYRVRVPAASTQDANTICANVKAAGGDCVPM